MRIVFDSSSLFRAFSFSLGFVRILTLGEMAPPQRQFQRGTRRLAPKQRRALKRSQGISVATPQNFARGNRFELVIKWVPSYLTRDKKSSEQLDFIPPSTTFRFHGLRFGYLNQSQTRFVTVNSGDSNFLNPDEIAVPENMKDELRKFMPNLADLSTTNAWHKKQWNMHVRGCIISNEVYWGRLHTLGCSWMKDESLARSLAANGIYIGSWYTKGEFVQAVKAATGLACKISLRKDDTLGACVLDEIFFQMDIALQFEVHALYARCAASDEIFLFESIPMRRARENGKRIVRF